MNDELLSLLDILAIIRRHLLLIVLSVVLCEGAALFLVKRLPKKFKSSAQLNLKSSYFDLPGIGEGLSYAEVQAQKQALLQLALNESFLDKEGEKLHLYKSEAGTAARESEREGLRKKIEFSSSTATTFRISALGPTAAVAFGLTTDSLDQIVEVLADERRKAILAHRESLANQLVSMGITIPVEDSPAGTVAEKREELKHLESRLAAMKQQYTSNHPTVIGLEKRIRILHGQLNQAADDGTPTSNEPPPITKLKIDPSIKDRRSDFGEELLKKINYLDIALELEANRSKLLYLEILERPVLPDSYIFPNPLSFVVGGFMVGLLLAGLIVAFREVGRAQVLTPAKASYQLGLPLLGTLPPMLSLERAEVPPESARKGS